MNLAAMLNEKLIFVDVPGKNRQEVYAEILHRAASQLPELPLDKLTADLIAYEDAHCVPATDVVMPHLKLPKLKSLYVIVAILREPVMFHDYDNGPCRIVIMSLLSQQTAEVYLKTLAALVRFLGHSINREALFSAKSAGEVIETIQGGDLEVRKIITAADFMRPAKFKLHPEDHLAVAWDIFINEHAAILPVVDSEGRLLGEINALKMIQKFIPKYMVMMKNSSVLESSEPFSRMFHEEHTLKVKDYMQPPAVEVDEKASLVQLTIKMAEESILAAFVVDKDHKLLGVVTIVNIVRLMLRS